MDDKKDPFAVLSTTISVDDLSYSYSYDPYADVYHGGPVPTSLPTAISGGSGLIDTITVSGATPGGSYSSGGTGGTGYNFAQSVYTTSGNWAQGINDLSIGSASPSGKLKLQGEKADIEVNGVSLCNTIKEIQERLNILCPHPELEAQWDELREIRNQYEAKLQECKEKSEVWKALQQMPPPKFK